MVRAAGKKISTECLATTLLEVKSGPLNNEFKVMSYNCMSQSFADQLSYYDSKTETISKRLNLIATEINHFTPDIVSLQDLDVFASFFRKLLNQNLYPFRKSQY